jgi:hypothetical protein
MSDCMQSWLRPSATLSVHAVPFHMCFPKPYDCVQTCHIHLGLSPTQGYSESDDLQCCAGLHGWHVSIQLHTFRRLCWTQDFHQVLNIKKLLEEILMNLSVAFFLLTWKAEQGQGQSHRLLITPGWSWWCLVCFPGVLEFSGFNCRRKSGFSSNLFCKNQMTFIRIFKKKIFLASLMT